MNDVAKLKQSAQHVQDVLRKFNLPIHVVELSTSTRTAQEAANSIGCDIAQIVKSLVFHTTSKQPVLILASGINRVNEKKISLLINDKITKADADVTRQATGFAIGGVPPIGHTQAIRAIFIDETLLKLDTLWGAAGTPFAVFSIKPNDLARITGGVVTSI